MRQATVYRSGMAAGLLTEESRQCYVFRYHDSYLNNPDLPAVSLTLPKTKPEYQSAYLFPPFFNMLSEGVNRTLQCRQWQLDDEDFFGLLLATAQWDTIGAITVKPVAA